MSTSNFTCESEAPGLASSIDSQLEHLARPLLLTNTVTNALIFTELNSISETVPDSLIRQKGHNSDLSLKNPEPLLVSGDHPFDPGGHSHIYPTLSLLPSDAPFYPPLTDDIPCRELLGSWGRRPCQPGACSVDTNPVLSKGRSQPVTNTSSAITRRTSTLPAVPYTSARKICTLQATGRNTSTLTSQTTPSIDITPTRLYDDLVQEEYMSLATHYTLSHSEHTCFPYKNHDAHWRCSRQHNYVKREHFKESYGKIAVKRFQRKSKLKRVKSRTKRKGGTLASQDLPQPMPEATAALLLHHKRRNRPGHTPDAAPGRRRRQHSHTHYTHHGRLAMKQVRTGRHGPVVPVGRDADHTPYEVYAKYYYMHVCTYTNTGSPGLANPAVSWAVGIG